MDYLNYKNLEDGDQVSQEHPVTGKVYDFEVTDVDWNDDWQPVELQLLDEVSYGEIVNVSEYAELLTLKSKLEESGYLVDLADCEISWQYFESFGHRNIKGAKKKMNFEELQKLKGGDFVQEQVTGAIFEVIRVEFYPGELKAEDYVSIPLYVKLVNLPEGL